MAVSLVTGRNYGLLCGSNSQIPRSTADKRCAACQKFGLSVQTACNLAMKHNKRCVRTTEPIRVLCDERGKRNIASVPLPNPFYIAVSQLFNLADEECGAEVVKWRKMSVAVASRGSPQSVCLRRRLRRGRKTATQVKPGWNKSVRADL